MHVMMSWARSTLANAEYKLARTDRHIDRILVVVMIALAIATVFMFSR